MIDRHVYRDAVWVDLSEPTSEEIESIVKEFSIDHMIARELLSPSLKHRFEKRDEYLYLILHFPAFKQKTTIEENQEVDFIIGKNFIITTHYEEVDALERFTKLLEVESILNKNISGSPRDLIFFGILNELANGLTDKLSFIEDWIKDIKTRIFNGNEKNMVFALSDVSRHLLDFKKITDPYHDALKSIEFNGGALFGPDFAFYARGVIEEFAKAENVIKNEMISIGELRETNNSLLTTKQNEVMKALTMISLVTFPLTLVAAIFSMDTRHTPIVGQPNDFVFVMGIMALVIVIMISFFKYKKWL